MHGRSTSPEVYRRALPMLAMPTSCQLSDCVSCNAPFTVLSKARRSSEHIKKYASASEDLSPGSESRLCQESEQRYSMPLISCSLTDPSNHSIHTPRAARSKKSPVTIQTTCCLARNMACVPSRSTGPKSSTRSMAACAERSYQDC